jgi:hypothetical protein
VHVQVLVHGFLLNGPCSYLHNPWNVLDGFIVVVGAAGHALCGLACCCACAASCCCMHARTAPSPKHTLAHTLVITPRAVHPGMVVMGTSLAGMQHHTSLSSLRALRTLRALRPLRVASRLEGMKVVINSLFASLPALGNVLLVCLLMYVIFGIMAVDLLGVSGCGGVRRGACRTAQLACVLLAQLLTRCHCWLAPHQRQQGAMRSCQDSSGRLLDAAYVLPAGQPITRAWCEDGSVQVSSSAYHSRLNVSLPAYTPDKQ